MTVSTSGSGVGLSSAGQSHILYDQQEPSVPNGYALHHHTQASNGFQLGMWRRSPMIDDRPDNIVS